MYQGVKDKTQKLTEVLGEEKLDCVAYVGDDLNDLACMERIKKEHGIIGCPADAAKQVKKIADYISSRNGGNGAVREFIEWLME